MTTYTYRHIPGHSALDHLAAELVARAERLGLGSTKRERAKALRMAIAELRATMGPRTWPRIDIVPTR